MYQLVINQERCKGCGFCVDACPRKALHVSEHFNNLGSQVVEVDDTICVQCGICYTVCPDYVFRIEKKSEEMNEVMRS